MSAPRASAAAKSSAASAECEGLDAGIRRLLVVAPLVVDSLVRS